MNAIPSPTFDRQGLSTPATEDTDLISLGSLAEFSEASDTSNLDWALIRIDSPQILSSVCQWSKILRTQSIQQGSPVKAKVQVMTTTNRTIEGTITGGSTFMRLPNSIAFQEMWKVQLDRPLGEF